MTSFGLLLPAIILFILVVALIAFVKKVGFEQIETWVDELKEILPFEFPQHSTSRQANHPKYCHSEVNDQPDE